MKINMNSSYCLMMVMSSALVILVASNPVSNQSGTNPGRCTQASDCGTVGCCLNGTCSRSGQNRQKCYLNVQENGGRRYQGIWEKTDQCPCDYGYYCWNVNYSQGTADNIHPVYGATGKCNTF